MLFQNLLNNKKFNEYSTNLLNDIIKINLNLECWLNLCFNNKLIKKFSFN